MSRKPRVTLLQHMWALSAIMLQSAGVPRAKVAQLEALLCFSGSILMFARPIISFTKELVSRRLFFELGMLTFFLVNVCLLSSESFQSPINAKVLAHLIPFLQSLCGEFVVVDDFNEDFSVIATTNIDQEVRGHWIQSGASTC
eukprot:s4780_g4.t1